MSLRSSRAIAAHELRVAWSDPGTVVFVVLMPLLMVAIMKDLFASALTAQGIPDANGSEFAVPGLAVAFAAFNAGYAGFGFFRDHGWGTWDRLRATPASSVDLMAGKIVPAVLVTILQLGLLFVLGGPLFGLTIKGSIAGLILIIVVLALCLAAFGMAITAVSRTMQQLNALGGVGGVALAMLGGAWVPVETMPGWARAMAPGLPTYWAMKGFESIIIKGEGVGAVLVPVLVVAGFGVLFTTLAALRFRFDEPKVYYG